MQETFSHTGLVYSHRVHTLIPSCSLNATHFSLVISFLPCLLNVRGNVLFVLLTLVHLQFHLLVHKWHHFVTCDCAYRHHISSICSPSHRHAGCFHYLTVRGSVGRSMSMQASPEQADVGSLGYRPMWGIARSYGSSISSSMKNS